MKYAKIFLLFGLILIILPFTGFSLSWKNGIVVAIGAVIAIVAIFEQVSGALKERKSSFKRISVERRGDDDQPEGSSPEQNE